MGSARMDWRKREGVVNPVYQSRRQRVRQGSQSRARLANPGSISRRRSARDSGTSEVQVAPRDPREGSLSCPAQSLHCRPLRLTLRRSINSNMLHLTLCITSTSPPRSITRQSLLTLPSCKESVRTHYLILQLSKPRPRPATITTFRPCRHLR